MLSAHDTELGNSQAPARSLIFLKTVEAKEINPAVLLPGSTRIPEVHSLIDHTDVVLLKRIQTILNIFLRH